MHTAKSAALSFGLFLAFAGTPALAMDRPGSDPGGSGPVSVPEPGMVGLMGLALLGLAVARRRKT
ncbi:PEP-CTERM sorting domain-containing protein [Qipengyuania sp. JC766]|uniref:PEP-CTERM sorting domain-containing protein n=1 Tax=Qipengyuania sp. JC766 TaxID=3232139 RepID=UPI0034591697